MKKLNTLFLILFTFYCNAQVVSGTVFSKEDSKPIPYVKIGV
ncbi:hypothetical protein [Chryseobacterium polytrichastri]|nr:hypothetical protein [Chryseobacterium polytrichastri]